MSSEQQLIISGAGLVGSLLGLLLGKRGYRVDIYERRPDFTKVGFKGGRSINLAMSNRGWKALEKAGVARRIREHAIPMNGRMMHDPKGVLTYQPYGKDGQAIYSVSRGDLNIALVEAARKYENVQFFFEHKTKRLDLDSLELVLEREEDGVELALKAPGIIGADGAFSSIRYAMQRTNRFNYTQHFLDYGYKELTIPPNADGTHQMDVNALHIWPRGRFMLIALPNPDGSFTCTLFLPYDGEDGFNSLTDEQTVLRFFETHFADTIPLIPNLLKDFKENPTSSLVTIRCNPWHHEGRVLLVGDASHAIVPFYGQGMNSGFEDCTILDEMLEKHGPDWPDLFRLFSQERVKDANAIADLALRNFIEMRDLVADPQFLTRKKVAAKLHEQYPDQFLPLYSMVTFSHIPYSEALREGKAQDVLFDRLFRAVPNLEEDWNGPEATQIFQDWMQEKEGLTEPIL